MLTKRLSERSEARALSGKDGRVMAGVLSCGSETRSVGTERGLQRVEDNSPAPLVVAETVWQTEPWSEGTKRAGRLTDGLRWWTGRWVGFGIAPARRFALGRSHVIKSGVRARVILRVELQWLVCYGNR